MNPWKFEIASTFNEELFVDYAMQNYDRDTAVAVLAQQIDGYISYFTFNPMDMLEDLDKREISVG